MIVPSHHTAIGARSVEHKECCDIITDDILVKIKDTSGGGKYIPW